ncbi:MAG: phenylacetate--CoA ligase family protein [Methyloligellaceae bacterium]
MHLGVNFLDLNNSDDIEAAGKILSISSNYIPSKILDAPYLNRDLLNAKQLTSIQSLIATAYSRTPLYKELYAGGTPDKFKSLDDIRSVPVLEKQHVLDASLKRRLSKDYEKELVFKSVTCGTTTNPLDVCFDRNAILTDTFHGIRQIKLQSQYAAQEDDITTHYYSHPWWLDNVGGKWKSNFISIEQCGKVAADKIISTKPDILAGYPSLLNKLIDKIDCNSLNLKLIITNSEFSTIHERNFISKSFGCPVLDEYSSEELTRIALEMPDGYYYINEDCVYLEVLDPITRQPIADGEWGEAVVTSLLNQAMPFIRYATGDWVKKPSTVSHNQMLTWRRLEAIGGRIQDSLKAIDGSLIPSAIILNEVEEKIHSGEYNILDFCIVQKKSTQPYYQYSIQGRTDISHLDIEKFSSLLKNIITKNTGFEVELEYVAHLINSSLQVPTKRYKRNRLRVESK